MHSFFLSSLATLTGKEADIKVIKLIFIFYVGAESFMGPSCVAEPPGFLNN